MRFSGRGAEIDESARPRFAARAMAKKLNWGIITTGGIAKKFATDLPESSTGKLVAVAARDLEDAKRFAANYGAERAYGSYAELLADPGVDAVYVATPHPWHAEWAIKAAEAGKHILCEKPLTLRAADTERVIAAAQQHNVLLMEAFMYRFHPVTRRVVEIVRQGTLGEVRLIRASFSVLCPFDPKNRMFNKQLGGGAILDLGCYPISYARHIAGAIQGKDFLEPVKFLGTGRLHPEAGTDDFATAVAEFPGGVFAELSCGSTAVSDNSVRIYGSYGWLEVQNPYTVGLRGKVETITLHLREGAPVEIPVASDRGLYAYEADAVGEAVARGEKQVPLATWDDTRGTAKLLDQWVAAVGLSYD